MFTYNISRMNKYIFSILLLIIYPVLIQYLFSKKNINPTNCREYECKKSVYVVETIKNSIIKHGLNHTIQRMEQLIQTNYDNIYIWEKKNNNYFILYHENSALKNKFTPEANRTQAKTCPKITTHLTKFVDTQNNGFTQYNGYNDIAKEFTVYKAYTDKINNVYDENINKTIYISSSFIKNENKNEIDYNKLYIQILSYIMFIILWYTLDNDELLKPSYFLSQFIFWIIVTLNFIKLLNIRKHTTHIVDQEKLNDKLDKIAGILAGITLSISLFFRAFLDIGFDRKIAKHILILYTISFIFAILSLIHVPTKLTLNNLQIKYYIKNEFLYSTCIFFILSIISISLHFH